MHGQYCGLCRGALSVVCGLTAYVCLPGEAGDRVGRDRRLGIHHEICLRGAETQSRDGGNEALHSQHAATGKVKEAIGGLCLKITTSVKTSVVCGVGGLDGVAKSGARQHVMQRN